MQLDESFVVYALRVSGQMACCELYHGTLDVCTENEVHKYHCMCTGPLGQPQVDTRG
jgi:hypothetical protein